jgi:hypothetical protein
MCCQPVAVVVIMHTHKCEIEITYMKYKIVIYPVCTSSHPEGNLDLQPFPSGIQKCWYPVECIFHSMYLKSLTTQINRLQFNSRVS